MRRQLVGFAAVLGALCVGAALALWGGLFGPDGHSAASDPDQADRPNQPALAIDPELEKYPRLEITYPFDEAMFPPEIIAPTFRWTDPQPDADAWLIRVEFADGGQPIGLRSSQPQWKPEDQQWETIKKRSLEKVAKVTILGVNQARPEEILSAGRVRISTSRDEVGAPIFYREVNLPFAVAVKDPSDIKWRFGSIASKERPRVVLENIPTCANCHSFSADGSILAMDVDSANDKGSYVIAPVAREMVIDDPKVITWSDYAREEEGELTFGLLAQISPDGRYAMCMVRDASVFVDTPGLEISQLFFPVKGILVYYDRDTKTFHALPGADDKKYVQANPTWSPDGKTILFAKHEAHDLKLFRHNQLLLADHEQVDPFLTGGKLFRYDLYRIPFNDGKGGTAEPLPGASQNGMSNYFPKFSPDGKWIVFCKANSFMLLQPDSELYIMPAEGGQARRMRCNTGRLNSWHSWSPNGKWLVFSSKVFGPYTQLFLAHVDGRGESTPPVLLENFVSEDRAANIPEFVNTTADAIQWMRQEFVDDVSFVRAGFVALRNGDDKVATGHYLNALKLNPKNAEAHGNLGVVLLRQGEFEEAKDHIYKAVEYEPTNPMYQRNVADLLVRENKPEEAMKKYREVLQLEPKYTEARINLGLLLLIADKLEEGAAEFAEAARLDPDSAPAQYQLGRALSKQGKLEEALAQFRRAVELDEDYYPAVMDLATILATGEDRKLRDGAEAVRLATKACVLTRYQSARPLDILAAAYAQAGRYAEASRTAREALQLARDQGLGQLAREIAARMEFYARGQPAPAER